MSSGKNIEIRMAAVGGDAAAQELRKPADAIRDQAEVTRDLAGASQKAAPHLADLANAKNKVSSAGLNMRSSLSNVGYQIQDFAVQVGMGTSAVRAFSQQAPQLLSAFGPYGIAAGAAIAIGAPLVDSLLNTAEAAAAVKSAFGEAVAATVEMSKSAAKEAEQSEANAQMQSQAAERIREITTARYDYNESIQRTIDLLKEDQKSAESIYSAAGQLEIERAGGDPVKQEEIRNRLRQESQDRELRNLNEQKTLQEDLIKRKAAQQEEVRTDAAANEDRLKKEADAAGKTALEREQTAKLAGGQKKYWESEMENPDSVFSKKGIQSEIDAAAKSEAEYQAKAKESRSEEARLRKEADDLKKAAAAEEKRLQDEMRKLSDQNRAIDRETFTKKSLFSIRDQQGNERLERTRRENESGGSLNDSATSAGQKILSSSPRNATVQAVGKALADGTDAKELSQLEDMVRAAFEKNGSYKTQLMLTVIQQLQKQDADIQILRKQIKNK